MNLSRFFTLAELSHSNTAVAAGIPNLPGDAERAQLTALCTQVLDPLREAVGQSIRVTSGYRGPALNARIGGSTTSQHMKGQAVDLQTAAVSVLDLFKTVIRLGLPFDQVIFEAKNATTKWVHVSHNPAGNRGEIRVAEFDRNGKPVRYPLVSAEQALALVDRVTRSARPGQWPDYHETGDEPDLVHAPVTEAPPARAEPALETAPAEAVPRQPKTKTKAVRKAAKKTVKKAVKPAAKGAAKHPDKKAATKAAAKKLPEKKVASKQAVPKKAASKKAATNKAATKKAVPKKTAAQAAASKAAVAKKATKKVAAKAPVAKKVAAKKPAAVKSVKPKSVAPKRAAVKKAAVKKAAVKKTVAKKAVASTAAVKKVAAKKKPAGR